MKPLVIYHANCLDGFGAAWAFRSIDADFRPGIYGQEPPEISEGQDVYLLDFSYKRPHVEGMLGVGAEVTVIDHHKTAIEDLSSITNFPSTFHPYFDTSQSGCVLAWHYIKSDLTPPPQVLLHIQDRDLWKFELPHTREICAALSSYPQDFKTWDQLILETLIDDLVDEGRILLRQREKDIRELLKLSTQRIAIGEWDNVPTANVPPQWASDAGHLLCKGVPFSATYYDTPEGRKFSLRSEGTFDVSELARELGGGGHPRAAGFTQRWTPRK